MDTKTIMAALALLGSATFLNGCDGPAKATQSPPEGEQSSPAPAEVEVVRARPERKPAGTELPLQVEAEPVRSRPESEPAGPESPATSQPERARPRAKPGKTAAPAKVEAREVTPAAGANQAGQEAADMKGEMKCGEGKCGGAANREP